MDTKSDQTFKAGNKLLSNSFYSQCVHCFYYSVIQMMKYCLNKCDTNPISYVDQETKAQDSDGSSHIWILNEISYRISNRRKKDSFDNDFNFLKKERVSADYSQRSFTQLESADCKQAAERMLAKLRDIR